METPRTDEEADHVDNWHNDAITAKHFKREAVVMLVSADFARTLERENAELRVKLEISTAAQLRLCNRAESAESALSIALKERDEAREDAEVIGNVTAALLDLNVTYFRNTATFTFESTDNAMAYILNARKIVEARLAALRGGKDT